MSTMTRLAPIKGVAYTPVPSDDAPPPPQKYFDTDFTNSTFPLLWDSASGGRGDLAALQAIGVNFLHLYDWSVPPSPGNEPGPYQRNHLPFLAACARLNIKVFVPISNYFLELIHQGSSSQASAYIRAMVAEIYGGGQTPVAGAAMWGVGNEYDLAATFDLDDVVGAMALLVQAEDSLGIAQANRLPVTSPVSFAAKNGRPPAIQATQDLIAVLKARSELGADFISDRFVASMNPFNDGAFLQSYIDQTFPGQFASLPFFFAEMGIPIQASSGVNDEADQAEFVLQQLKASRPRGNFLGVCVFQFLNQTALKSGTEATFGMTKYTADGQFTTAQIPNGYVPGGGSTYRVDELVNKPLFAAVQQGFQC